VAADIANKMCDSVASKMEGKVLGTFDSMYNLIRMLFPNLLSGLLHSRCY